MHILVIEDEPKIAQALKRGLEKENYKITVSATGEDGFFRLNTETFDLVVLDLMLPGRDGLEILTSVRKKEIKTPVIVLTARDAVLDRVRGLDCGADDYLIKPFAFPELLARIRSLLRRKQPDDFFKLSLLDLEMDITTRKVTRHGSTILLTLREYNLLEYLLRHQGRIVSREMLAHDVWKEPARATPLDNVIDVHISRLRQKIDEPFRKKLLHTIRGVGFSLGEKES